MIVYEKCDLTNKEIFDGKQEFVKRVWEPIEAVDDLIELLGLEKTDDALSLLLNCKDLENI